MINRKNLIYIASLVFLFMSLVLAVEFPNSNRIGLLGGVSAMIGFLMNVAAFLMPNRTLSLNK